jgi:hypothetical protein
MNHFKEQKMEALMLKQEREVIPEIVEEVPQVKNLTNPDHQVQNIQQKISYIINIMMHEIAFLL